MYYLAISLYFYNSVLYHKSISQSIFIFQFFPVQCSNSNSIGAVSSFSASCDGRSCARQGVGQHFRGGCSNHLTKRPRFSWDGDSVAPANDKITVITSINLSIVGCIIL